MLPPPSEALIGWSQLGFSFASVAISYLLYTLYGQQKEILAANHRAHLSGEIVDSGMVSMTVELSNYGNGMAKDLKLWTFLDLPDEHNEKYHRASVSLRRSSETNLAGTVLQAGEMDTEFEANPKVSVVDETAPDGVRGEWVVSAFGEMQDDGIDDLGLLFAVGFTDMNGKSDLLPLNQITMRLNPQTDGYTGYSIEHTLDDELRPVNEEFSDILDYPDNKSWDSVSGIDRIKAQWAYLKNQASKRLPR